jgi:choline-sulfatase
MILAGPDVPAGNVVNTPVNLTDCYTTILEGLGADAAGDEPERDSRSLFDLAKAPDDFDRTILSQYHAFGSPSAGYMLRKGRYKYHHYVGYAPELFDLDADPEEMNDLADNSSYRDVLAEYEALLRTRLDPDAVDRRAKADQAALVERHGGREAAKLVGVPGATPVPGYSHE